MMMVFLKSTGLPGIRVSWPSSKTCSRRLKTGGALLDFVEQKDRIMAHGLTRCQWPPSFIARIREANRIVRDDVLLHEFRHIETD